MTRAIAITRTAYVSAQSQTADLFGGVIVVASAAALILAGPVLPL